GGDFRVRGDVGMLCGTFRSSCSELLPGLVGIEQVRTPLVDDHPLIRQQLIIFPSLGMDLEQLPLCHALAVANKVIDTFGIKAPIWCWFNDQRVIFSTLGDHAAGYLGVQCGAWTCR